MLCTYDTEQTKEKCNQPSPQKKNNNQFKRKEYKSNQLYRCFIVWDAVFPTLLLPALHAMNRIVVNDAIFTTGNLKQILFRPVSATDVHDTAAIAVADDDDDDEYTKGANQIAETVHMY